MAHNFICQNIYAPLVWKLGLFGGEEKQIKASFPCKFMKMRAEVERKAKKRKEKKKRGSDGGWKWSGASVLYECLCAALAKKNKAWATLGSDFWKLVPLRRVGRAGQRERGVGGGYTSCPPRGKRFRDRTTVLFTQHPTSSDGWCTVTIVLCGWRILNRIARHRHCSCQ